MHIRELSIPGSWEVTPLQRSDDRGVFFEWYRFDNLQEVVGHPLDLRQANSSVSAKGVLRGIHFADLAGQAKYVTVANGAMLDFIVDIRIGSPTYGQWDSVLLDTVDRRAVYLSEGLGHAIVALTENATVNYLVTDTYKPHREHGINPLDPEIGLAMPEWLTEPLLSPKDLEAPSLAEAAASGLLPVYRDAVALYESMKV